MKTNKLGFAGIAALVAVIVAIIIGGAYVIIKNNTSQSIDGFTPDTVKVEPSQPDISTADWQTYTNTQYGFEIQYPSGWKAGVPSDKGPFSSKVVLFCPLELADGDPGLVCKLKDNSLRMSDSEAPIVFSLVSNKLTLAKKEYQETYDHMLSTLKFTR